MTLTVEQERRFWSKTRKAVRHMEFRALNGTGRSVSRSVAKATETSRLTAGTTKRT